MQVIIANNLYAGVCNAITYHVPEEGYKSDRRWIQRYYMPDSYFWHCTPTDAWEDHKTKDEIIECLHVRVDIMKKELARPWWKF